MKPSAPSCSESSTWNSTRRSVVLPLSLGNAGLESPVVSAWQHHACHAWHGPNKLVYGVWSSYYHWEFLWISYNACINPYHIAGISLADDLWPTIPFSRQVNHTLTMAHVKTVKILLKKSTSNKARIFTDFHSTPTHVHLPNFGIAWPSAHSPPAWAPWAPWAPKPAPFSWPSSWRSGAVLGRLTYFDLWRRQILTRFLTC